MQLIVFRHDSEDLVAIEVPDEADSDLLYQLLAAETGKQFRDEYVEFEGQPVRPSQSLMQLGILDGSTLFIKRIEALQAPSASANPSVSTAKATMSLRDIPANIKPDQLLQLCIDNPHIQTQLNASDPELGAILAARDIGKLRTIMMKRYMARHKQEHDRQLEQRQMEEDPMNPEVQKKIEEQIRRQNIEANMEAAMENLPESFGRVTMLYVNIAVNGHPVKAFVDSGAQSTIMSIRCAERCNITHLIDTRLAGQARGVGTAKILGRVHIAQMRFGNSVFPISITILETNDVDFLFGLDTLRRYRCCIDLSRNLLRIDGANGPEEIPFLGEGDLPEGARNTDAEDLAAAAESAAGK